MSCPTHAGFNEPRGFPSVLVWAWRSWPTTESRPRCEGGSVSFFESCADGVFHALAPLVNVSGVAPCAPVCSESSARGVGQLHASRRLTPPAPRAAFVSALSAPRSPSCADDVGKYRTCGLVSIPFACCVMLGFDRCRSIARLLVTIPQASIDRGLVQV